MKLPSGWTKTLLHQVAHVQTGLSKSENRKGASVRKPYLRVANVQDGYLDLTEIKEIEVPINHLDRFRLQDGDVLLTEGGDFDKLGRGCMWRSEIPDCVHQNHVFTVRVIDRSVILPQFLACQVRSPSAKKYFLSCSKQTTNLASINSSQLKRLSILLPSLNEQKKIVDLLSICDISIEKTEQLIAAKKKYRDGAGTLLLDGKLRFPEFLKPWKKWHLGELFEERVETGRLDLPLLSITRDEGVIPRGDVGRKDTSSEDKFKYLRICSGDIGYNTMRMWQGVSALSRYEGLVSPAYTICTPGPKIDGKFSAYLFKLPAVVNLFYRYSQGLTSDTWSLKFHHFAEIKVTIPPVDEQIAIAAFLSSLDTELTALNKIKDALVKKKRGLMQKLLSGEWRINVPAEAHT